MIEISNVGLIPAAWSADHASAEATKHITTLCKLDPTVADNTVG